MPVAVVDTHDRISSYCERHRPKWRAWVLISPADERFADWRLDNPMFDVSVPKLSTVDGWSSLLPSPVMAS